MDKGAWQAIVHGITRVRHDLVTKPPPYIPKGISQIQHSKCLWGKGENTSSGSGEGKKNTHIRERASVSPIWLHDSASQLKQASHTLRNTKAYILHQTCWLP